MTTYNELQPEEREYVKDFVHNAMLSRQALLKQLMDGDNRSIDTECQYPDTDDLAAQDYKNLYEREAIAARVVEVMPKESWKSQPSVYEDEDPDTETEFEIAWTEVNKGLRSESHFKDEEGSPVWELLRRADVLSGIGRYGAVFLGLDDGLDPSLPASMRSGAKLLYARVFDETQAQVTARETDQSSPRYGLPTMYLLTLESANDVQGSGVAQGTINAHWTRVLHVVDNLGSSEVFGMPRMKQVYNRLLDLRKLYGGSAEMYWRGAFPGISVETHPQLGGDVEIDVTGLREQMQDYMHGLQRYLALMGMSAKSLAPQVSDPSNHIDKQIEAVCILIGVPKRIFMGSERGELASGQDDETWNNRVEDRQNSYLTPRLIAPFVDKLIMLGVLPEPAEGYSVDWPPLSKSTEIEKADVAVRLTEAMSKYVGAGVDVLIEPLSFLTVVLGMPEDEAKEIMDATEKHVEDGGLEQPEDELDQEGRELDLEAKRKNVELIGKEPSVPPGGDSNAFGKQG